MLRHSNLELKHSILGAMKHQTWQNPFSGFGFQVILLPVQDQKSTNAALLHPDQQRVQLSLVYFNNNK